MGCLHLATSERSKQSAFDNECTTEAETKRVEAKLQKEHEPLKASQDGKTFHQAEVVRLRLEGFMSSSKGSRPFTFLSVRLCRMGSSALLRVKPGRIRTLSASLRPRPPPKPRQARESSTGATLASKVFSPVVGLLPPLLRSRRLHLLLCRGKRRLPLLLLRGKTL
ncbi:hypothetical protein NE237_020125 [Protea cynaroides]|uniref:Uncharacterized protein n=1 Tax=Protea cynaroides TaxID=273540 RepID=A0A9Q0K353_9MAGN|nr:hypothetical protein NE237_020125 [Protea cynaroides]